MDQHIRTSITISIIAWISIQAIPATGQASAFPLLMPDVQPSHKDAYLCTAFKMNHHTHEYIVKFWPNATMATAHHILIYGCAVPGFYQRDSPRFVWDCGEMATKQQSELVSGPTCSSESQIIYAWAMEAPPLKLPQGVGFKVGGDTNVNYLVLQVHYANIDKFVNGMTDNSGITLSLLPGDTKEVTKRAGVLLLGTGGYIPSRREEHMETSCKIEQKVELHPFAFRTHTHKLGKVVSGWRINKDDKWTLIGKHDPQKPQMFYPVDDKDLIIKEGETVAARCTMVNPHYNPVYIGATTDDEMCNFYMMYYVEGDRILENKYCFSSGPPYYYWARDSKIYDVPNEVDKAASEL